MKNIAIIGSGSWGVALGIHMAKLGHNIKIWSYLKEEADLINNERKCKFLPEIELPDNIIATQSYEECIKDSEYIFQVTPSQVVRNTVRQYKEYVDKQPIIICSKGFEKDTLYTLNEIVEEELNVKTLEFTDDVRAFTSYTFKPQLRTVGPKFGKILGGIKAALDTDVFPHCSLARLEYSSIFFVSNTVKSICFTPNNFIPRAKLIRFSRCSFFIVSNSICCSNALFLSK